jgi:hypothetical protein
MVASIPELPYLLEKLELRARRLCTYPSKRPRQEVIACWKGFEMSPRFEVRVAGGLYLLCILLGMMNLFVQGRWNSAIWILGSAI